MAASHNFLTETEEMGTSIVVQEIPRSTVQIKQKSIQCITAQQLSTTEECSNTLDTLDLQLQNQFAQLSMNVIPRFGRVLQIDATVVENLPELNSYSGIFPRQNIHTVQVL